MIDYFIYKSEQDSKFVVRRWEKERSLDYPPRNFHWLGPELGRFATEQEAMDFAVSLDKKE